MGIGVCFDRGESPCTKLLTSSHENYRLLPEILGVQYCPEDVDFTWKSIARILHYGEMMDTKLKNKIASTIFVLLGLPTLCTVAATFHCYAQSPIDSIAESHINANVPDSGDFGSVMKRDLEAYFRKRIKMPAKVTYELLRDGPTQTGIAYPKFYVWVKIKTGEKPIDEGAVQLAAIGKKYFDVTDFLSITEIKSNPEAIYKVFPRPVCDKILAKLK